MSTDGRAVVLLLTATVDPGDAPMVTRRDPAVRLEDYRRALEAWLRARAAPRVVFCENSGHDLSLLERLARGHPECSVEFITFVGNESSRQRGKGYSELEMIERAMEQSAAVAASEIVVKCTGRLIVRNAVPLMRGISASQFDIMCSLKQHLTFADSRMFAATPAFLHQYLWPQRGIIDDFAGVYVEHALACAAARVVADRGRWRPLPILPRFEGISGTNGTVMTDSPLRSAGKAIYHRFRRFVYGH